MHVLQDNFYIIVETYHLPDRGDTENAHELDKDKLKKRIVVPMDIATDEVQQVDYKKDEDPSNFKSEKTGRKGHLAMVKEKRLVYRFGELAVNCRASDVCITDCQLHDLCKDGLCLWTKE